MTRDGDGPSLRTLREAAGVSLGRIVKLTDYSKGHLSKVETGSRVASARLIRVYESLGEQPISAPGSRSQLLLQPPRSSAASDRLRAVSYGAEIRRARNACGLSQRDLAELVGTSHVYISKIENGQAVGTLYAARQLDRKLGAAGELLKLFRLAANQAPRRAVIPGTAVLDAAARIDTSDDVEAVIAAATARLEHLRRVRHLVGPAEVVDDVVANLVEVEAAAARASITLTRAARIVQAHNAEFLSWLAEELSEPAAMREWMAFAVRIGADDGDTSVAAYAAIRRSATALRAGDPSTALAQAQAALAVPNLPLRLRRIALHREARASARAGDREGFRRAMDSYRGLVDGPADPPSESRSWGPVSDPVVARSRLAEATGLMDLEEFRAAADVFATAMPAAFPTDDQANPSLAHARVRFAIREATAYAHVHECERAADVIESFLPAVQGEAATVREDLRRLAAILSRRRAARLRELTPDVLAVARPVGCRIRIARAEATYA